MSYGFASPMSIGTVLADTLLVDNELNSTVFVTRKQAWGSHRELQACF